MASVDVSRSPERFLLLATEEMSVNCPSDNSLNCSEGIKPDEILQKKSGSFCVTVGANQGNMNTRLCMTSVPENLKESPAHGSIGNVLTSFSSGEEEDGQNDCSATKSVGSETSEQHSILREIPEDKTYVLMIVKMVLININGPIQRAVELYKKDIDWTTFSVCFTESGPLQRMDGMIDADFDQLISKNTVKLSHLSNGFYSIDDGRHRISRAIIEGKTSILALVSNYKEASCEVKQLPTTSNPWRPRRKNM